MERTRASSGNSKTGSLVLSQSFKIGALTVRYYSLTFVAAVIAGYFIGRARAVLDGIRVEVYDDIVFWTILAGFVGARIYYVLFYWQQYSNNLSEIYKVWHGGIAIYGGIIGGAVALYYAAKKHKIRFLHFTDLVVLGL